MVFLISSKSLKTPPESMAGCVMHRKSSFDVFTEEADLNLDGEVGIVLKGNIYTDEKFSLTEDKEMFESGFFRGLEGSFTAFRIEEEKLKVFRDYFGSKPVYFLEKGGDVFISDRIKPLLNFTETKPDKEICRDYLHSGLVNHRRRTFFEGIKQLRPRETLSYVEGNVEIEEVEYGREPEFDEFKSRLRYEVERRIPDENIVCPVSGGVDSTVLASLVKDRDAEFIHSSFEIDTGDDDFFQAVNKELGLEAEVMNIELSELIEEINRSIDIFEQPTSMIAIQAQNMMFRRIRRSFGKSAILDGTGADEIFYGYPKFTPYHILDNLVENPLEGLREFFSYRHHLSRYNLKEIVRIATGSLYSNRHSVPELEHEPDFEKPLSFKKAVETNFREYNFPHLLNVLDKSRERYQHQVSMGLLSQCVKREIESREPDENYVSGLTKYRLRASFNEELPDEVFYRKKKTGFIEVDNSDIDKEVRDKFREVFGSERFKARNLFDGELFYRRFESGLQGFFKCYRFYCFECWMRSFID